MNLLTVFLPLLTIQLLLIFFLTLPKLKTCVLPMETPTLSEEEGESRLRREDRSTALSRKDLAPILILTLVYALTAFFRLGSLSDPQSFVAMEGQEAVLTLPEGAVPSRLAIYPGVGQGSYSIFFSEDGENYENAGVFNQDYISVLKWTSFTPESSLRPRTIRIQCFYGQPWLGEVLVLDGDGLPIPVQSSIPALCDEPETAPEYASFQNSSYFDEIYHARTAWEHLNGVWPYEITHPPLGKEILSLGILLFGMTPFGWRFSGTLFGVLMLPLLYIFLKKLFGGRWIPSLGTLFLATDFMHYVQTRIATIDTYSVFFILLMYLFLYLWISEDRLWALALCGISFGLGAASKWTSIYAGAGLALLWAIEWVRRFVRARRGKKGAVIGSFVFNVFFCLVFFIALPALIYLISYLPYARASGVRLFSRDYLAMVWENQNYMFTYHAKLVLGATHPYSSVWYQWLVDYRPILYVMESASERSSIRIAAWLNPVLCWGGLMSLPPLVWMLFVRKDRRAGFILAGYLSQLLPWVPVTRLTFAYHYFPSTLFLVLSLSYFLALRRENERLWRSPALILVSGSAALFLLFFPVLNGLPISVELSARLLRWLPTWPF